MAYSHYIIHSSLLTFLSKSWISILKTRAKSQSLGSELATSLTKTREIHRIRNRNIDNKDPGNLKSLRFELSTLGFRTLRMVAESYLLLINIAFKNSKIGNELEEVIDTYKPKNRVGNENIIFFFISFLINAENPNAVQVQQLQICSHSQHFLKTILLKPT